MPTPTAALIYEVVRGHLQLEVKGNDTATELVDDFVRRVKAGDSVAIDQLLGTLHLLNGPARSQGAERERLIALLMKDLSGA